jgi:UDP-2,3-diacylglucosamine pyrophosphatase LpxH
MATKAHQEEFNKFSAALSQQMEAIIKSTMENFCVPQVPHTRAIETEEEQNRATDHGYALFHWGDKFRAVPQQFQLAMSKAHFAWDQWWGLNSTLMPLRTVLKSSYKNDTTDSCNDAKNKKNLVNKVLIYHKVMDYLEEMGQGEELDMLKRTIQTQGTSSEIKRELITKIWRKAWDKIKLRQGIAWQQKRKHDLEKQSVVTVFRHMNAEEEHKGNSIS